ncbi:sulfatase family protein [Flammeovirga agarivorans]|uniref:Sulfatase n=1 Tax=Flammeovirga agarivorans TaxID=2726742 RepID=A0A7X8XVN4_9BACT|nr:sulfatase [Flammeovirga agarivorans]NLR91502.1 sulfatase [Flammeovirga agarivorans]
MMKTYPLVTALVLFCSCLLQAQDKPNLLIIHTDEHNLRTIGAYRNTMSEEQAMMWGKDVIVETPHLDRIANEGVLCKNWYATSPVCTPSRASMMTGLYPVATGSPVNDMPLNDDVITFGQILKDNGYSTSYVGKWHLDGEDKPGFAPKRKFGFEHNRYMINRGHWKALKEEENGVIVDQKKNKKGHMVFDQDKVDEKSFTTDFLVDRALKILEQDKDKPFCLMLSIPDPHGPNQVRAPYNTMYDHLTFEEPRTIYKEGDLSPGWVARKGKKHNTKPIKQNAMRQYYGMVKCIDDNVGRILKFLEDNDLEKNTIVIFTSDHGDLLREHGKDNKGLPYEMSARVAFMLRYPSKIKKNKTIQKAFSMADFTPTILGIMGVDQSAYTFHGANAAKDFTSKKSVIDMDRTVYITNARSKWVAAVDARYKLVVSPSDEPWLFDLEKDPDELVNYYNDPEYKSIAKRLKDELYPQMKEFDEPLLKKGGI